MQGDNSRESLLAEAEYYFDDGEYDRVVSLLEPVASSFGSDTDKRTTQMLMLYANALFRLGRSAVARRVLEFVIAETVDMGIKGELLYTLAITEGELGNYSQSRAALERAEVAYKAAGALDSLSLVLIGKAILYQYESRTLTAASQLYAMYKTLCLSGERTWAVSVLHNIAVSLYDSGYKEYALALDLQLLALLDPRSERNLRHKVLSFSLYAAVEQKEQNTTAMLLDLLDQGNNDGQFEVYTPMNKAMALKESEEPDDLVLALSLLELALERADTTGRQNIVVTLLTLQVELYQRLGDLDGELRARRRLLDEQEEEIKRLRSSMRSFEAEVLSSEVGAKLSVEYKDLVALLARNTPAELIEILPQHHP